MRGNSKRKREKKAAPPVPPVELVSAGACEHCDTLGGGAPAGQRFCSKACADCENDIAPCCPECTRAMGIEAPVEAARTVQAAIDHIVDALPSDPEAEAALDRAMAEKSTGTKRLLRVPVGPTSSEPMLAAPTPPLPFDEALRAFAEEIRPRIREAQKNDLSKYLKGAP